MKKAQLITVSVCAVGAIALLVAGYVLFRGISRFGQAREDLGAAQSTLEGFYREPVFPSAKNVQQEQSNKQELERWYHALAAELRKGNVVSNERSPSAFKTVYLEKTLERLSDAAQSAGTELPTGFGFGFERYAGTPTLPRPDDVPRLMEQLVLVNRVCRILFANRVKALTAVGRATFEDQPIGAPAVAAPAPAPAPGRRASPRGGRAQPAATPTKVVSQDPGVVSQGALFGKYRFVIEFSAKESALIGVLNALVASPSFSVVKVMRLKKDIPVLMPVAGLQAAAAPGIPIPGFGAPPATAAPPVRLGPSYPVSGVEMEIPMQVRVELDIFKFKGDSDGSGD